MDIKKYANIFTAKVTKYGRITVPKEQAEIFGIQSGDMVVLAILNVIKVKDECVEIIPVSKRSRNIANLEEVID
ncbi:MAG: hypothetical protein DRN17_03435 [Thermoplasmata archaeon]|nr:MAG: hypothetical protein DRN17_03435 [Thermoplasmata archaeon]